MNLGTMKLMLPGSSSLPCEGGDQFPAGLRVLVVDDDPTCLRILEKMLRNCLYQVTICNRAEVALTLLRENINGYDVVISDVHMPDMDGFKLLEQVGLLMDLPVIMMSADDSKSIVMKGVTHGACDYLIKPVRMEALKNIWQHVVRKKRHEWKNNKDVEPSGSVEDEDHRHKPSEDVGNSSSANEGNWKSSKKRRDEDDADERNDSSNSKKPRVVWSVELHQQFVAAVKQLGIEAVPKKILELMNVPGLTRENVASHLQKYRLYLKKLADESQHQGGNNNIFMGLSDTTVGPLSSYNGLDLHALAASAKLPAQIPSMLQPVALGRSTNISAISLPLLDQRNLFSFEASPTIRFGEGQQQMCNNSKQISLLHGIPTNVEPKQLPNLHSAQPFASMNTGSQVTQSSSLLMQINQPQGRSQLLTETNGCQVPRMQSSIVQNLSPNAIPAGFFNPKGLDRSSVHNPLSQSSSLVDLSMNQNTELPGNGFPLLSNLGINTHASKGMLQQEVNSQIKESNGFIPGNDLLNGLYLQKTRDWGQNVRSTFDVSQRSTFQGCGSHSGLAQQCFSSSHKAGQNPDVSINKGVFSVGEGAQHNTSNMGQLSPFLADTSTRIKAEGLPDSICSNNLFSDQFGQEDLISALLKRQDDGSGPIDNDFGFDGYPLDV